MATDSKKMFGLLPPSSRVTGMMFWLAYCMISRPVVVSPVKATFATRDEEASGLPASTPKPLTTLTTPAGSRSPISSISLRIDHGGLLRRLEYDGIAGRQRGGRASTRPSGWGKFHGMIWPTTPSGSWKW